ncbi:unnamed protein product [Amoebophrya sp. A25]|nr:unnamed protein product [Amoebophrya sp. A25]|eukprot:GSA25T00003059001.1
MRLLTKAQAARSRLLKVVAGTYRLSEFDANTVYLLFKVSKPAYRTGEDTVTDHDAPANVFVGNGTAWVLQFSSSRSRFQVIDIFSMGDEWTVGPERDPTNGQGSVNYLGFTYQQMFRLVTQGNDEFADEGQVLQHVVQGMMQEPPK